MSLFSADFAIQLIVATFGAGGAGALISFWRDKRKADADATAVDATATDVIQGSSKRQVLWFEEEMNKLRARLLQEETKNRALESMNYQLVDNAREHKTWDDEVVRALNAAGINIRPAPVLHLVIPANIPPAVN